MIQTDEAKVVLAGGMEAMSQAPFVIRGRDGFTLAPGGKLEDSLMVACSIRIAARTWRIRRSCTDQQQGITGRCRMSSRCVRSKGRCGL